MSNYWVIAPVEAKDSKLFDKIWAFDLANNVISIGWSKLGDISNLSKEELLDTFSKAFPEKPTQTKSLCTNMIWSFYHEIKPGDIIIARKGRKTLSAVGKVIQMATYSPGKNPDNSHPHYLGVEWQQEPQNINFDNLVFNIPTLSRYSEMRYRSLLEDSESADSTECVENDDDVPVSTTFVLEKYLEEFIVSNFNSIFTGKYKIYEESEELDGQQYPAGKDRIDILAIEPESNAFVVIELKKGRTSDQVVGQILRYMGWVKKNLCNDGQTVKGLIIGRDHDSKLSDALEMTNNINVKYYSVSFNLRDSP
jgi:restriction system protein